MADSKIQWTEKTWNPFVGCSRKSGGCKNCYAEKLTARLATMPGTAEKYGGLTVKGANGDVRFNGVTRFVEKDLLYPLTIKKPTTFFVCSMADLFHENNSFDNIDKVFAVMAVCQQHTFQVLTKRPERALEYLTTSKRQQRIYDAVHYDEVLGASYPSTHFYNLIEKNWPLPNVWLGTSVENQQVANERIPLLLQCTAAVRFLSCEPLLGEVYLTEIEIESPYDIPDSGSKTDYLERVNCLDGSCDSDEFGKQDNAYHKIHWVIVGGESGKGKRHMNLDWARSLRDQCISAGVAFFYKQGNSKGKDSDRLLDGREWNEMPNQKGDPKTYIELEAENGALKARIKELEGVIEHRTQMNHLLFGKTKYQRIKLIELSERDRWRYVETEPPTESGYYEINTSDLFAYFSNSPNAVSKWVVWGMNGSEEPINKPTHWRHLRTDRPKGAQNE